MRGSHQAVSRQPRTATSRGAAAATNHFYEKGYVIRYVGTVHYITTANTYLAHQQLLPVFQWQWL